MKKTRRENVKSKKCERIYQNVLLAFLDDLAPNFITNFVIFWYVIDEGWSASATESEFQTSFSVHN